MKLQVQKLYSEAKLPSFAHSHDAGMDLYTVEDVTIEPGERVQIRTGISMTIPAGYVGLIWDKSGISHKIGLKTLGGVIDAGYRGEVTVAFVNTSDTQHVFVIGDKMAQMLIQEVVQPDIVEVSMLEETERGSGAFGSTGK